MPLPWRSLLLAAVRPISSLVNEMVNKNTGVTFATYTRMPS